VCCLFLQVFSFLYRGKSEKRWRVLAQQKSPLRYLISAVEMFLDSVDVVEGSFEIPMLQMKLSVSFPLSLNSDVCFCTRVRRQIVLSESDNDLSSEDNNTNESLLMLTFPSKSSVLQVLDFFSVCSKSSASQKFQMLVYMFIILIFRTKTWFDDLNCILWSCKLEHKLAYPIVLSYFIIIKISEVLYNIHFGLTQRIQALVSGRGFECWSKGFRP